MSARRKHPSNWNKWQWQQRQQQQKSDHFNSYSLLQWCYLLLLLLFFRFCCLYSPFLTDGHNYYCYCFIFSWWTFDGADFINDCDYFRFVLAAYGGTHHLQNNALASKNQNTPKKQHKQKNNNYWKGAKKKKTRKIPLSTPKKFFTSIRFCFRFDEDDSIENEINVFPRAPFSRILNANDVTADVEYIHHLSIYNWCQIVTFHKQYELKYFWPWQSVWIGIE